ncbi:Protein of unknown function [Gryllus bimaculatus]|nr:Protein of unknown function [Gryllus bimaculatus]
MFIAFAINFSISFGLLQSVPPFPNSLPYFLNVCYYSVVEIWFFVIIAVLTHLTPCVNPQN